MNQFQLQTQFSLTESSNKLTVVTNLVPQKMKFCFAVTSFYVTTFLRDSATNQCEDDDKEHKSTIKFSYKFFTIFFHTCCHVFNQYKPLHYFILSNINNVTCIQTFDEIFPEITRKSC